MVAAIENANLQRPHKKITVEYLAWDMENVLGSRLHSMTVQKTCTYTGSKVSKTCRSWLQGTWITRCVIYSSMFFFHGICKKEQEI